MTYTLYIANKRYSSWSMRPWVLLTSLGIPFEEVLKEFDTPERNQGGWRSFSPSGLVPCLHDSGNSAVIWDSFAIVEYVAESHPGVWPSDPVARAFARSAVGEMHSSFLAIRNDASMNVGVRIDIGKVDSAMQKNIDRLGEIFELGLGKFGGPWLAGKEFTAVDAFFAPIASRRKTYSLEFTSAASEYLDRLFEHKAVQEWVRQGRKEAFRDQPHEEECLTGGRKLLENLTS